MKQLTKRLIALGVGSTIAVAGGVVGMWEGKSNQAYKDIVGIPTICWGQTLNVKMGEYRSDDECDKDLATELVEYNRKMKQKVKVPLSENEEVAYTSFVWNVGLGAWNSSTLLEKLNVQDRAGACKELLRWNKAGGKVVKGLQNRREHEYKICMGNDADVNQALKELREEGRESLSKEEEEQARIEAKRLRNEEELPTPQLEEINVSSPVTEPTIPVSECRYKFLGICFKKQ